MDEPIFTKNSSRPLSYTEYETKIKETRENKELSRMQKDLIIRKLEKAKTDGQSIF